MANRYVDSRTDWHPMRGCHRYFSAMFLAQQMEREVRDAIPLRGKWRCPGSGAHIGHLFAT